MSTITERYKLKQATVVGLLLTKLGDGGRDHVLSTLNSRLQKRFTQAEIIANSLCRILSSQTALLNDAILVAILSCL